MATGLDGVLNAQFDLTAAARAAIAAGETKLTVTVQEFFPSTGAEFVVESGGRFATSGLGLWIDTDAQGVQGDLLDSTGRPLATAASAFDLSTLPAGTYYLGVFNPNRDAQSEALPFTIGVDAPILGQPHPATDRDEIRGGDGDDRVIGSGGVDRLFGDSGDDLFRSFSNEIRDIIAGSLDQVTTPSSVDGNDEPLRLEVFDPRDSDPQLRAAVARALGIPITTGFDGSPVVHEPIFADQAAGITQLDLAGLTLVDTSALSLLPNLEVLNLSHGQSPGELPLTLTRLEYLAWASAGLDSIDGIRLSSLPNLREVNLRDNDIRALNALAGNLLVDDGDAGFTEFGSFWMGNINPVEDAFGGDYRFLPATGAAGPMAEWRFENVTAGDYDIQITWPEGDRNSQGVTLVIDDGTGDLWSVVIDQTQLATGTVAGGRPWQSLGLFAANSVTDDLTITIDASSAGILTSDAVRLVPLVSPTSGLSNLDLRANPLDTYSRDAIVPAIEQGGTTVLTTPAPTPFGLAPIAPQQGETVPFDGALAFDDQILVLPNSNEIFPGSPFDFGRLSIEFWLKTPDTGKRDHIVSGANSGSTNALLVAVEGTATNSRIVMFENGTGSVINVGTLRDDQWHHVVVIRDDIVGQHIVYVDGDLKGSNVLALPFSSLEAQGLVIGQDQDSVGGGYSTAQSFRGEIDELRFWNKILTAQEINARKDIQLTGDEPQLLLYYSFNESSGEVALDGSPRQLNATFGDSNGTGINARPGPTRVGLSQAESQTVVNLALDPATPAGPAFFTATTNNPEVVTTIDGETLILDYPATLSGVVTVTVTAHQGTLDAPTGRTDVATFDLHVDSPAIYGSLFHDLNGDGARDSDEPSLAGWQIDLDTGPRTYTDANGEFRFALPTVNLIPDSTVTVLPQLPPNWELTAGDPTVVVDGVQLVEIGLSQRLRLEGTAGIDEGDSASFSAVYQARRPAIAGTSSLTAFRMTANCRI